MKHFRISIDVDVTARDRGVADRSTERLCSAIGQHPCVVEVLPNGIEERVPLTSTTEGVRDASPAIGPGRDRTGPLGEFPTGAALPSAAAGAGDDRAAWVGRAVTTFCYATGSDEEDALCDLLTDLMYWADQNRFAFAVALERAEFHYECEINACQVADSVACLPTANEGDQPR